MLTDAELSELSSSHDIIAIGVMADEVRKRLHGSRTTFLRVAEVDLEPGRPVVVPATAGEARIVGVPKERCAALGRVEEVRSAVAGGVPVSAFSLADLEDLAVQEQVSLRTLLEDLRAAGLELLAEAPVDRLRDVRRSIEEVNIAGLTLGRLTVHDSSSGLPELLRRVEALQRQVAVIRAFAPLARFPGSGAPTTGYDDVRRVALARIWVQSVPSIQVDWSAHGPKLAQVALTMGADDLDGVSPLDDLSAGRRRAPLEVVRRNITSAGLEPVERDGRFEPRT